MNLEKVRNQIPQVFPENGLTFHGTSAYRARSIQEHGFDSSMAPGGQIDPFRNHFMYFNPDPAELSKETLDIIRLEVGELIYYAKHSKESDPQVEKNYPVIMVLTKPSEAILTVREEKLSKKYPTWIVTNQSTQPRILGLIPLKDLPPGTTNYRQSCKTLKKVWKFLKEEATSPPKSLDRG